MVTKKSAVVDQEYDAASVKHLGSREAVQQKTAMYMGSTDEYGIFTCLREATDNIIDEAINGHSSEGELIVLKDLEYWVRDNGRGMPVGLMTVIDSVSNQPHKIPALQAITSLLHAGAKLKEESDSAYQISRGSHGCGLKGTNFLASFFKVYTFSSPASGKPKQWHYISYKNGILDTPITKCAAPVNPVTKKQVKNGTIVHFKVDQKFFSAKSFPPSLLLEYLQTSSYFTPGFTWTLTAAASGKTKTYHSENGALDYITEYKSKLPKVASMKPDSIFICSSPVMDVAVDFTTAEGNHLKGFTNGLFNAEGGDHVDSFFRTLQKSLEPYKKKGKDFTLTEIKEGVLGIVNAKLAAPKFSSQVKVKLQDERAAEPFRKLLQVELDKFFKKNKSLAESICLRCAELKNLRSKFLASKQVVMELRKIAKKGFPVKALMAPKCKASERELYLVEGDSAMGGITGVRNAHFQEVFPLKGKIMNAHRATSAKFFQNEEVLNILAMIGFDPKAADPYSNLRVSKLVFMTDADADGDLAYNTKIKMVDGTTKSIGQLAKQWEKDPEKEIWVWGHNKHGELIPTRAYAPMETCRESVYLELTFDDGTKVKCTKRHSWPVNNLELKRAKKRVKGILYTSADKLQVGDSIPSTYFSRKEHNHYIGYEHYVDNQGKRKFLHRRVKEYLEPHKFARYDKANEGVLGGNVHIHHKDENKLNNLPSNLKFITRMNHSVHHAAKMAAEYNGSDKHLADLKNFWDNNPEHRIKSANCITKYNKSEGHRETVRNMNANPDIIRLQYLGRCARFYLGLRSIGAKFSDWSKYKTSIGATYYTPDLAKFGFSLDDLKKTIREKSLTLNDGFKLVLVRGKVDKVSYPTQTLTRFLVLCRKVLELNEGHLDEDSYNELRDNTIEETDTRCLPKWSTGLEKFEAVHGHTKLKAIKTAAHTTNHVITKIREVHTKEEIPYYCMSVPETGNYLLQDSSGNGILTGNCHISVLLLSMVHKYFPELIERGIIYVAEVPEFMAMVKNKPIYADSKDEMKKKLEELKTPKANVFHFKGLGEMESDVLGAVGMNPATRMIRQITPTDSPSYNEDFVSIVSGDASSRRTLLGI